MGAIFFITGLIIGGFITFVVVKYHYGRAGKDLKDEIAKLRELNIRILWTMEEAGFKLSGVFIEKVALQGKTLLRMVSTDGHRLSMIDKEIEGVEGLNIDGGVMIPKKGMLELSRMVSEGDKIHFGFKKNNCVARKDGIIIVI